MSATKIAAHPCHDLALKMEEVKNKSGTSSEEYIGLQRVMQRALKELSKTDPEGRGPFSYLVWQHSGKPPATQKRSRAGLVSSR